MTILVIFEIVAIYYVFLAYREFKGMEYDATGGVGGGMGGMMGGRGGGTNPVARAAQAQGTN